MKETDYQGFYDLVVPRLFEVSTYQKMMCGKVDNIGKKSQADVTETNIHNALTYLDQFTQDYLLIPIYQAWPDLVPLVEEDTGLKRNHINNNGDYSLIMDPIDGTAFYLRGDSDYSIMLGLMKKGKMVLSIICYPEKELIIATIKDQGAWTHKKDGNIQKLEHINTVEFENNKLSCHYRFSKEPYNRIYSRLIEANYKIATNDDGFGTNATGILRITNGESSAFIGPHISLHDFAVPAFIIEELGGVTKLFDYQGLEDVDSWDKCLNNYGSPDPKGANPRYRVIIGNSEKTIDQLITIIKTKNSSSA